MIKTTFKIEFSVENKEKSDEILNMIREIVDSNARKTNESFKIEEKDVISYFANRYKNRVS
ncbi:MAG: hypothetical protein E7I48_09955 [Clostridium celatum]|nr:hypothetical protein [Clostridium celatum]